VTRNASRQHLETRSKLDDSDLFFYEHRNDSCQHVKRVVDFGPQLPAMTDDWTSMIEQICIRNASRQHLKTRC
jgi:hypothetical protein